MPKRASLLEVGPPFIHVQVRTTDVCARDLDQGVRGLLDPWVWNVADANVPWTVIDNSLHHTTSVGSDLHIPIDPTAAITNVGLLIRVSPPMRCRSSESPARALSAVSALRVLSAVSTSTVVAVRGKVDA